MNNYNKDIEYVLQQIDRGYNGLSLVSLADREMAALEKGNPICGEVRKTYNNRITKLKSRLESDLAYLQVLRVVQGISKAAPTPEDAMNIINTLFPTWYFDLTDINLAKESEMELLLL